MVKFACFNKLVSIGLLEKLFCALWVNIRPRVLVTLLHRKVELTVFPDLGKFGPHPVILLVA